MQQTAQPIGYTVFQRTRSSNHVIAKSISKKLLIPVIVVLTVLFLVFIPTGTESIDDIITSFSSISQTAQSSAIQQYIIAKNSAVSADVGFVAGQVTLENSEMIEIFTDPGGLNASTEKAFGLLACYNALVDGGLQPWQTLGLLGCAAHEGEPGLVQYGYPHNLSPSLQPTIWVSRANNKLVIDTPEKRTALLEAFGTADAMGIGTAQWTYGRCKTWLEKSAELYPTGNLTIAELYEIDYAMYASEFQGTYKKIFTEIDKHCDSLESLVVWSCMYYESGYGNYRDDSIASYGDTFRARLTDRLESAKIMELSFKSSGLIR